MFSLSFLMRLTFNAQRSHREIFSAGLPEQDFRMLTEINRNTASIYFWRIRFYSRQLVSCSVTEYASSASSLTEYSLPTCSDTLPPIPFSRTGHSFYRQILNTESPPVLPADIQLQGQLINTWFSPRRRFNNKKRWMADDKHPGLSI